jgi:tetratricopeptide (TPR) repeat protein
MSQDPLPQQNAQGSYIAQALGEGAQANVTIYQASRLRIPMQKPPRAQHFTDREDQLAQILDDLKSNRPVTLCGPGGMGKSDLAAEAVWNLAPDNNPPRHFPDGIIFHSFYRQPQADVALEVIARAFGEEPKPTPQAAAERALAGRRVLLLLDGTEDADDLHLVRSVAASCGVLITSRQKHDAIAGYLDLPPLPTDEATQLLRAWSGQQIDEAAQRICQLVGGLPLAMRIAGRYLAETGCSAAEYLEWLEQTPVKALSHGKHRQESIEVLLQRSIQQVSQFAQQVLAVVGLLAPTSFSQHVVTFALSEVNVHQALGQLVNYGLLDRDGDRYEISHALIHTYTSQKIIAPAGLFERLCVYFTKLAEEIVKSGQGYHRLDVERVHILRILTGCEEREDWNGARNLARIIDNYLDIQGHWAVRIKVNETGLAASRILKNCQDEGKFLGNLGNTYRDLGQMKQALTYYEQALAIFREVSDRCNEGIVLGNLGIACHAQGQINQARDNFNQALVIARDTDDRRYEGIWLYCLGNIYRDLGQMKQAFTYYEQALSVVREVGDRRNEGIVLVNLGIACHAQGQIDQARDNFEQALVITRETGDRRYEGVSLCGLGNIYRDLGQVKQASVYNEQTLLISPQANDRSDDKIFSHNPEDVFHRRWPVELPPEASVLWLDRLKEFFRQHFESILARSMTLYEAVLEKLRLKPIPLEQASDYYEQALSIFREIGDRRNEGIVLSNLGIAYYTSRQIPRASDYYEQALSIFRAIGDRPNEGLILGNLGNINRNLGHIDEAAGYYKQALSIARETDDLRYEAIWLYSLGNAYRDLDQGAQASAYYEQAYSVDPTIDPNRPREWGFDLVAPAYDTLDMVNFLKSGRISPSNIVQLSETVATRANIIAAFDELDKLEKPSDSITIYYSGHGGPTDESEDEE